MITTTRSTFEARQAAVFALRDKGFTVKHNNIAKRGWIVIEPNGKAHEVSSSFIVKFAEEF